MQPDPLSHQRYLSQRYFGSLDGLRCASILAVIWHHGWAERSSLELLNRGFLGVDMFFVLSGFLIVTLTLRERDRRGQISLQHFYMRRVFRIFPIYYGLILLVTLGLLLVRPDANMAEPWFQQLPILLTYTSNWFEITTFMGISWSLAAEEQFYLLWPPVERYLARWWLWILGALIAISQLIQFGLVDGLLQQFGIGPDEPSMLRETTFTPILLGVLLAHLLHSPRGFRQAARVVGHRLAPLVIGAALLAMLIFASDDIRGWERPAIHLLMFTLLAGCVVREDNLLAPLLRFKPIARIGVISYGMYLLHLPARHVADAALHKVGVDSPSALFLLYFALTILICELSYRYYETPFLKFGARFR